jgi:hypothetical protein
MVRLADIFKKVNPISYGNKKKTMDAKTSFKKKNLIDKFQISFFIGYLKWILKFIYFF